MLYLIGSIVLTSYLTLCFKFIQKYQIAPFQAILFNYFTCVITGSIVNGKFPVQASIFHEPWFKYAILMGAMFISIFNVMAFTTQKIGVAVASVANKLSLVIPFVFSVILYHEKISFLKILGILIALLAVVLTCWPANSAKTKTQESKLNPILLLLVPTILFLSSGLLDTLIKYVQQNFLDENSNNAYLSTAFLFAGCFGTIALIYLLITKKQKFNYQSVLAGIGIGIPNYFSIWCLVKVLKANDGNSSAIIPINNMGIVLFSTLMAWILFKEKITALNILGIILSVGAIALISFG
jgi:drug/metabolite transporter (DMT)-like permease